ncbi:MAG: hypothetical protein J7500_18265 [Sphingomonas sp.]|uniref:hypothetical protein n=1 Tax=Sphingomonas sp. TaxID=28214 RepID=UPI001B29DB01|nr:hypothetical protein [Sphingomonas sp.]MBO9624657.1 hypothetical protein [Sphingomonas sp.]
MISKPLASLSSGLLARKGQARPAMRPQGFVGMTPGAQVEDLGWNDMGDEAFAPAPMPVAVTAPPVVPVAKPVVLRQIEALDEQIAQAPMPRVEEEEPAEPVHQLVPKPGRVPVQLDARPVPDAALARVAREVAAKKGKAAFTLRLDQERHVRLRLASAVTGRSAQQLVTQALDQFLETMTEVEALARQLGSAKDNG